MSGHSAPAQEQLVSSTPAVQAEPLSLVPLDSPGWESQMKELDMPFTPDTFEAARNLIDMATQHFPVQAAPTALEPAAAAPAPCGGGETFQGQTGHAAAPVALSLAPIAGTIPHSTAVESEVRLVLRVRAGIIRLQTQVAPISSLQAKLDATSPDDALATTLAGARSVAILDPMGISSSPGTKLQIPFDHLGQTVHIECVTEGTFKGFGVPLLGWH